MKRVALSVVVLLGAVAAFAQPPLQVTGVVRSAATGEGLPKAAVILSSRGPEPKSARATTSADGSFGISGLPPGQYQLTIRKPGYQVFQSSSLVTIRPDSAETTRVIQNLWPHGAIAGRVIDWEGEPVADAEVRAYALVYQTTGASLSLAARGDTTDLGEYRLFDLPAGKYVLHVSPPRTATPAGQYYADTAAVYSPGVSLPAQALPVELNWGQDVSRADVKLSRGQSYAITGAVWDASVEGPCRRCQVHVMQHDGPYRVTLPQTARVGRDGGFVLRGLSPGDYTVVVRGPNEAVAQAPATVRNRHVEDARLTVGLRQVVSGEVVLEKPPEGIDVTGWTPTLSPVALPEWWPQADGEVRGDRQFLVPDVSPARYRFELRGLPPRAYLKALRFGAQPLENPEILVSGETPVPGLQAVIGFDAATVQGKLRSTSTPESGQSVLARVFLIPRQSPSGLQSPRTTETNPDGSFTFASVAPGSYSLYALPAGTSLQILDPAVQAALGRYATQLDLDPNETVTIEVPSASVR